MRTAHSSWSREAQWSRNTAQGHPEGPVPPTLGGWDASCASLHPIPMQPDAAAPTSISHNSLIPGGGLVPTTKGGDGTPKPLSQQQAACDAGSHGPSAPLWRMTSGVEHPQQPGQRPGGCLASPAVHGQPGRPHVGSAGRAGSYSRQWGHCSVPLGFALPLCKMRPVPPCAGTVNALDTSSRHKTWGKDRQ